jgi:hypothetical protein
MLWIVVYIMDYVVQGKEINELEEMERRQSIWLWAWMTSAVTVKDIRTRNNAKQIIMYAACYKDK